MYVYTLDLSYNDQTIADREQRRVRPFQWEVASGVAERHRIPVQQSAIEAVRCSPTGTMLAVAGWEGFVDLLGTTTWAQVRKLPGPGGAIFALAFAPGRWRLVGGTEVGLIQVWDLETGDVVRTIGAHDGNVRAIAFSPDGRRMATAGHDWTIKIWDAP